MMTYPASILVVDDELVLLDCIERGLTRAGFRVLTARDGLEALVILGSHQVDLILTDIAMPRMNGYQLHRHVVGNPQWVTIPFLFLTARAHDSDIRYGKELGVDDYLTKPFDFDDLLASVRGKLRRARQLANSPVKKTWKPSGDVEVLHVGQLQIDTYQHRVLLNDHIVRLSAREFKLLEYLARRADEVVSLQELVQITHELEVNHEEASVLLRPLVRSLRRKLGYPAGELGCIESVRGIGYQLIPPNPV